MLFFNLASDVSLTPRAGLVIQNRYNGNREVQLFGSPRLQLSPASKYLDAGEAFNIDNIFNLSYDIPPSAMIYGFAAALDEKSFSLCSAQVIKKMSPGVNLAPYGSDGPLPVNFGNVEVSTNAECIQYLIISNPHTFPFKWIVRVANGRSNPDAFEIKISSGVILPLRNFTVPIRFCSEISGVFECIFEVVISEADDVTETPIATSSFLVSGIASKTSIVGIPDRIDFSNTLVKTKKSRSFKIENAGSCVVDLKAFVKAPFTVSPHSMIIPPKSDVTISVGFEPFESVDVSQSLKIFANQLIFCVNLSGSGGMATMECTNYIDKPISFKRCNESTISWISLYLTNTGNLPAILVALSSDRQKLIKVKYVASVQGVPLDEYQLSFEDRVTVKPDYWGVLRAKMKFFAYVKPFLDGNKRLLRDTSTRDLRKTSLWSKSIEGTNVPVQNTLDDEVLYSTQLIGDGISIMPHHSLHFKIGFLAFGDSEEAGDLIFSYVPDIEEIYHDSDLTQYLQTTTAEFDAEVVTPLQMVPRSLEFGVIPAGRFELPGFVTAVKNKNSWKHSRSMRVKVFNVSSIPQTVILQSISSAFKTSEKNWYILPGRKCDIGIEFFPEGAQIGYHGEAVLSHNFGTDTIHLFGNGGSAELEMGQEIDFGKLKAGARYVKSFELQNNGLLDCPFELDIIQDGSMFKFTSLEPFECQGVVRSDKKYLVDIECCCEAKSYSNNHNLIVRWKQVPNGPFLEKAVPLLVQVGKPVFVIREQELDFQTTYIDVNKTVNCTISNPGSALCIWNAECDNSQITLSSYEGSLEPYAVTVLQVKYTPTDFERHTSSIHFFTEVGSKSVMCSSVVGVPYLKVAQNFLAADFGIVTIARNHSRKYELLNTGVQNIEFDIHLTMMEKNGVDYPLEEFDTFLIEPTNGIIEPGHVLLLTASISPRDYATIYRGQYIIRTKDGEQYYGSVSATGGRAIVKIKPPNRMGRDQLLELKAAQPEAEDSKDLENNGNAKNDRSAMLFNEAESSKYVMQSHLDNLFDILAGLRSIETSDTSTAPEISRKNVVLDGSDWKSRAGTPKAKVQTSPLAILEQRPGSKSSASTPQSDRFLGSLLKIEKELDIAIGLSSSSGLLNENEHTSKIRVLEDEKPKTAGGQGVYHAGRKRRGTRPETRPGSRPNAMDSNSGPLATSSADSLGQADRINLRSPLKSKLSGIPNKQGSDSPLFAQSSISSDCPKSSLFSRPPTVTGSDLTSSEKSASAVSLVDRLVGNLAPRGFSPTQISDISRAEVENSKSLIESMLCMARDITKSAGVELDISVKNNIIETMQQRVLESTKAILRAAKNMSADSLFCDREFLTQAVKRLQMSTLAVQTMLNHAEIPEPLESDSFDLGIIRGGNVGDLVSLFSIPNEGNIVFEYSIVKDPNTLRQPENAEPVLEKEGFFHIDGVNDGNLQPNESVDICASFHAVTTGLYRQSYIVKSNDEDILKFTLVGCVGNPDLRVMPAIIDFGLIERGKTASKPIIITNVGTYIDSWRIECLITGDTEGLLPFMVSVVEGQTAAKQNSAIPIIFQPPTEGSFKATLNVIWSQNPLSVHVAGIGGGAKIDFVFEDPVDKALNGLDFGICIVGVPSEKTVKLKNIGTVDAVIELSHPSSDVSFDIARNSMGEIRIPANQTLEAKVIFRPSKSDNFRDSITVVLGSSGKQTLLFKAKSGSHDWNCTGELNFTNLPVLEYQTLQIAVQNNGTLEIPFDIVIMPPTVRSMVSFLPATDQWRQGRSLRVGQTIPFDITVKSEKAMLLEGEVVFGTTLAGMRVTKSYPFKFRVYAEQVALDNVDDVEVGRVLVGETVKTSWRIDNFGNENVNYRTRIENMDGEISAPGDAWVVVSDEGLYS